MSEGYWSSGYCDRLSSKKARVGIPLYPNLFFLSSILGHEAAGKKYRYKNPSCAIYGESYWSNKKLFSFESKAAASNPTKINALFPLKLSFAAILKRVFPFKRNSPWPLSTGVRLNSRLAKLFLFESFTIVHFLIRMFSHHLLEKQLYFIGPGNAL